MKCTWQPKPNASEQGYRSGKEKSSSNLPHVEKRLWDEGVLSVKTPEGLLNAVFYSNGKNFCLRGIQEQYHLRFTQLIRRTNPDRYTYVEHGSKNNSGGVEDYALDVKNVTSVAVPDSNSCHVKLLDLYLSHVPKVVIDRNERLHLHPSSKLKSGWYTTKPGKVQTMVKRMFSEAKIEGNYTNHTLRTTGASQLFAAKVPEAIIQKRTGH